MVNDLKTQTEWKIQLTIATDFCLSKILTKRVLCFHIVIMKKL